MFVRKSLVIVFLVVSWGSASSAWAQSSTANAVKYQDLRERLNADFLVVGNDAGMSLPAHIRHEDAAYVRWADATIDLGWYIAVLATELHLRERAEFSGYDALLLGIDTASELSSALNALERLDRVADASFAPECPGSEALNGFFIRDDVPANFHEQFPGMTQTRSDFLDTPATLKEMSQDQVYHLLLGLALVRELVPADLHAGGRVLVDQATELAMLILQKLVDDNWLIQNPVCDRDVARGAGAAGFASGTARIARWFSDGALSPTPSDLSDGIWELARDPEAGVYMNVDNMHMAMAIAAVGRGWDDETLPLLAAQSDVHRWAVYPLTFQVLHSDDAWCDFRDAIVSDALAMLDELPMGEFPQSPRPGGPAVHGFTVSNRFIRGSDQHYVGPQGSDGELNHGLDYMLLHNVAAIAAPELWASRTATCVEPQMMTDAGQMQGNDAGSGADMGVAPDVDSTDMGGDTSGDAGVSDLGGDRPTPPAQPADSGCCSTLNTDWRYRWEPLLLAAFLCARRRRPRRTD